MEHDPVNKPSHYLLMEGVEVRDVCKALSSKLMYGEKALDVSTNPLFLSDYVQMMQYLMRFMDKNGVEDLKKARWYLDKMIEAYE
jgi:hypothetical protein